jgi:hypothetical protein
VIITARRSDGPVECVVKLAARLAMPPAEYLFEWVASAVGRALGIVVPEPLCVTISPEFAAAVGDPGLRGAAMKSCGAAFGCELLQGFTQWAPTLALHPEHRGVAADLLAFDIYIHNADRRVENPNLLFHRDNLVAIDHDMAFAFCFPPVLADPVTDTLRHVVDRHAIGQPLKGKLSGFQGFRSALATLTDAWFNDLKAVTPDEWNAGHAAGKLDTIIGVLRARRDSVGKWLDEVEGWMT